MKSKLALLTALLSAIATLSLTSLSIALANDRDSGGGHGVGGHFLDLIRKPESKLVTPFSWATDPQTQEAYQDLMTRFDLLNSLHPGYGSILKEALFRIRPFFTTVPIAPINDAGLDGVAGMLQLDQVARQNRKGELLIYVPDFIPFSAVERSALLFHETLLYRLGLNTDRQIIRKILQGFYNNDGAGETTSTEAYQLLAKLFETQNIYTVAAGEVCLTITSAPPPIDRKEMSLITHRTITFMHDPTDKILSDEPASPTKPAKWKGFDQTACIPTSELDGLDVLSFAVSVYVPLFGTPPSIEVIGRLSNNGQVIAELRKDLKVDNGSIGYAAQHFAVHVSK